MINEEQIDVVQRTWQRVVPIADTAANLFYDRLFEMEPELRSLFPADLAGQKKKLLQMLGRAVAALGHPEDIVEDLQGLGERHVTYGVKDSHYPLVGAALLWTLEQGLGDAWTHEAKDAWTAAYSLLSSVMLGAARRVSQPAAADA